MSGGLAQVFGRRPIIMGALTFFAVGSVICGTAQHMNVLIAGRAVQGVGAGGIVALTDIIIADLVPLRERGLYLGLIGAVWAFAGAIGPPVGGAIAQHNWRWLFYLNLPLSAIAMVFIMCFLHVKAPKDNFLKKVKRIDWIGNFLVIASTTSVILGLSWGGIQNPWSSWKTLVPLTMGGAGLILFFYYEFNWAKEPLVPWELVNNRTSFFGYIMTFLHGLVSIAAIYYAPVFFQGSELETPIQSGIGLFGLALTIAPAAIICGALITYTGKYRPANLIGWIFTAVGFGTLSLLRVNSPQSWQIGFQVITGIGLGILFMSPMYAVIAPLPITKSANALALSQFMRSLAQTIGITLGSAILQNELKRKLPVTFLDQFRVEAAYALIPFTKVLEEPMKSDVRIAYADGTQGVWLVTVALSIVGFLCVFAIKELKMPEVTDEVWGYAPKKWELDEESFWEKE